MSAVPVVPTSRITLGARKASSAKNAVREPTSRITSGAPRARSAKNAVREPTSRITLDAPKESSATNAAAVLQVKMRTKTTRRLSIVPLAPFRTSR